MTKTTRIAPERETIADFQKQYHTQKRLADALFGLFRTLGSTLSVERVANVGLLTLTGQLLVKCAAFFARDDAGFYHKLSVVGAHHFQQRDLVLSGSLPTIQRLFRKRKIIDLDPDADPDMHPSLIELHAYGFRSLFPLVDVQRPLGLIALGSKVVPGALTTDDRQIVDTFGVVISLSLKNSMAYQLVETNRNELARLSAMKKEFLDHVSHEFRSPLTVLKSISEMGAVDPEVEGMQSSAIARLQHLVDSVLLLNEINANGVELDRGVVDITDWIKSVVEPMLARHGQFDLSCQVPSCAPILDWFKLGTALECIIDNAVKFGTTEECPRVAVYLSHQETLAERAGSHGVDQLASEWLQPGSMADPRDPRTLLVIEVKDRGIGIPSDEVDAVFQPFTQAANSPTRGVKGAGLGLSMAKSIVEAHGGKIFCRSAVGSGTLFTMVVPIAPACDS
jgi:signal transduction histidine kinase